MCGHHRGSVDGSRRADRSIVLAQSEQRVSDRERERAVEQLRLHVAQGRLSLDEFSERLDDVLRSRSGGELTRALRALPYLRSAEQLRAKRRALIRPFLFVSALLVAIWAASGFGFPWPVFPVLGWGLPVSSEWSRLRRLAAELPAN
jgi:hypothetical protein